MTNPSGTQEPLSRLSLLTQAVARHFSDRPTLRRVVRALLEKSLKKKFNPPITPIHLDQLKIIWTVDEAEATLDVARQQPIVEAVLEHIALGTPINYTFYEEQQCYLAERVDGNDPTRQTPPFLAMTRVEQSIREVVRDWRWGYQQALVDYWNQPVDGYRSRQHWLGTFFGELMISYANTAEGLSDEQVDVLRQVFKYPLYTDRMRLLGRTRPRVYFAQLQANVGLKRVEYLVPDLVVVYPIEEREHVLACKPSGHIESFASLSAYGRYLGRTISPLNPVQSLVWKRYEADDDLLQTQAMIVLDLQLDRIKALQEALAEDRPGLDSLERQLWLMSDPACVFDDENEAWSQPLGRVLQALPDWLKNASVSDRFAYRSHMINLANVMRKAKGRVFDEGIPDLHSYASKVLREQMLKDQPLAPGYYSDDIEIDIAVVSGPLNTAGVVEHVKYTLTELALQNLIAIPSGHMTITHKHNQLIQDWWMTPAYIKSLIQRVDVGGQYPALIKQLLIDDLPEAQRREMLFTDQLRAALPLQALERVLNKQGSMTSWGYRCIAALMQRDPNLRVLDGKSVVIYPLALLKTPRTAPDFVRAMFVIGLGAEPMGRCVLYRPLFKEVLIEYPSAQAMHQAISTPGTLRESVLHWLPDAVRAAYTSGHLSPGAHPSNADGIFYQRPLSTHFEHDVFRESALALALMADRQSVSNYESRWASLKEGGWLLLNTFLPVLRGPIAVAGWLLLTVSAVKQDFKALESDDERTKAPAIIDLFFNIALVLLHVAHTPALTSSPSDDAQLLSAEGGLLETDNNENTVPVEVNVQQGQVYFSDVPVGNQLSTLDFSWFKNPAIHFNFAQLAWLDKNRAPFPEGKTPVAYGPNKGLYVVNSKWYALINGFCYEVSPEEEGMVVVSPEDPLDTGPWIKSDGEGIWQFDTGMYLRGGGPKRRQQENIQRRARDQRIKELNEKYEAMGRRESQVNTELNAARARVKETHSGATAQTLTYLEKTVRIKHFRTLLEKTKIEYTLEKENFHERHALLKYPQDHLKEANFNRTLFNIASDIAYAQHTLITLLIDLHPEFMEANYQTLAINDVERFINMRRDLYNAQKKHLEDFRTQVICLQVLRESPRVGFSMAKESARTVMPTVTLAEGKSRLATELDFLTTHMLTLADLVPKAPFSAQWHALVEIVWPLTFTVQSHAQLIEPELFSHAERVEVLLDIQQRYARAHDALAILHLEVGEQFNLGDFNRLAEMVQELSLKCEKQLTEELRQENEWLPEQPGPSRSTQQASKIIRTRKHGILIGVPRSAGPGTQVVEVGEFMSGGPLDRSLSPVSARPKLTFRESSPDQWDVVEPVAVLPAKRTIGVIRSECNEQLGRVDPQINRIKVYAKNSKYPLELEEILEGDAKKLDGLANEIERDFATELHAEKPKPGTPQSLRNRLREGAKKLREQAIWVLKSLPPTEPVVEFLLKKNEVRLVKEGVRIKMFGPRNDYVQEYQVLNTNNQVLWYAHLHYVQLDTAASAPSSAHFKLRHQRKASKQSLEAKARPGERVPEIHYANISKTMLTQRFLPLEP